LKNAGILASVVTPDIIITSNPAPADVLSEPHIVTPDESWRTAELAGLTHAGNDDAPFLYNSTSGTTGTPKLMTLSQRVLCLRAFAAKDDFIARETVFCALFTPSARPYVTRILAALINGATIVHSRNFDLWAATGMNHLYGSVAQVSAFLGGVSFSPKLPLVHVSGSRLPDGLARHLLGSFEQVVDLYASSETNRSFKNIKYLDEAGNLRTRGARLDSEVQVVDENYCPVPAGQIGLIRVRNPYMACGYINAPEAQARSFREGWFYPGDFGAFGPEGELVLSGRSGDVINRGGIKMSALNIDDALREVQGVTDAMCFEYQVPHGPSELIAFIVPDKGMLFSHVAMKLSECLALRLPPDWIPARFVEINAVPRAHDGGAQRFICGALYERYRAK
jgi:acyl-CoA synthetase (AMP-forming)/AMP-acid ligase II